MTALKDITGSDEPLSYEQQNDLIVDLLKKLDSLKMDFDNLEFNKQKVDRDHGVLFLRVRNLQIDMDKKDKEITTLKKTITSTTSKLEKQIKSLFAVIDTILDKKTDDAK